jgi:hypothetical protein
MKKKNNVISDCGKERNEAKVLKNEGDFGAGCC